MIPTVAWEVEFSVVCRMVWNLMDKFRERTEAPQTQMKYYVNLDSIIGSIARYTNVIATSERIIRYLTYNTGHLSTHDQYQSLIRTHAYGTLGM